MKLLIVIPTYNEYDNIQAIIEKIFSIVKEDAAILVVDDASPDGTANLVEQLMEKYSRLNLLKRDSKQGLASTYVEGFKWGISKGYDTFLEFDADFSHNPEYIPEMIEKIKEFDVVIGSRLLKGGGSLNRTYLRNLVTKAGSLYSRMILGCPIKDLTGGFNMWNINALEKINLDSIISQGYCFQIEMKYKAFKESCKIVEIPIVFEDRKRGQSKMSKGIFLEAVFKIFRIKFYKN